MLGLEKWTWAIAQWPFWSLYPCLLRRVQKQQPTISPFAQWFGLRAVGIRLQVLRSASNFVGRRHGGCHSLGALRARGQPPWPAASGGWRRRGRCDPAPAAAAVAARGESRPGCACSAGAELEVAPLLPMLEETCFWKFYAAGPFLIFILPLSTCNFLSNNLMSKVFNITLTHAMMLVTGRPVWVELDVVLGRLTVGGTKRKDMMEYHLSWLNGLMPLNIGQPFDAVCLLKETMPQHRMNVVGILLCKKGHLPSFKTIGLYISYLTSCYRSFAVYNCEERLDTGLDSCLMDDVRTNGFLNKHCTGDLLGKRKCQKPTDSSQLGGSIW